MCSILDLLLLRLKITLDGGWAGANLINDITFQVDEDAGTFTCEADDGTVASCQKVNVVFSIEGALAGFMFEVTVSEQPHTPRAPRSRSASSSRLD